jgi:hypothetical protein
MRSTIRAQKIIVIEKKALLSILIQLNPFVTKKRFFGPQPKNLSYGTDLMREIMNSLTKFINNNFFNRNEQNLEKATDFYLLYN